MSKLKLLLLGGIFTLVGIFNFSNASTETLSWDLEYSTYLPNSITFLSDVSKDNFLNSYVCNNSEFCGIMVGACAIAKAGDILDLEACDQSLFEEGQTYSVSPYGDGYFDSITFNIGSNSGGGEGGELGQIIPGGFDNFTPAVNGLHEIVKQLIPLVIYLGIGILVVILGFIAIRWLVNLMSNGIKSKFSSKRG